MFILTLLNRMGQAPRRVAAAVIGLYQKLLSPDHSWLRGRYPYGYCKFYPSCSEYARQAVLKRGVVVGVLLGAKRILKCNPFTQGGVDAINS